MVQPIWSSGSRSKRFSKYTRTLSIPFCLLSRSNQLNKPRTTDTQWRHKSKISEKLGICGWQNMLRLSLKIWDLDWIFGRAVKAISSLGVRCLWYKPCLFSPQIIPLLMDFVVVYWSWFFLLWFSAWSIELSIAQSIYWDSKLLETLRHGTFIS